MRIVLVEKMLDHVGMQEMIALTDWTIDCRPHLIISPLTRYAASGQQRHPNKK